MSAAAKTSSNTCASTNRKRGTKSDDVGADGDGLNGSVANASEHTMSTGVITEKKDVRKHAHTSADQANLQANLKRAQQEIDAFRRVLAFKTNLDETPEEGEPFANQQHPSVVQQDQLEDQQQQPTIQDIKEGLPYLVHPSWLHAGAVWAGADDNGVTNETPLLTAVPPLPPPLPPHPAENEQSQRQLVGEDGDNLITEEEVRALMADHRLKNGQCPVHGTYLFDTELDSGRFSAWVARNSLLVRDGFCLICPRPPGAGLVTFELTLDPDDGTLVLGSPSSICPQKHQQIIQLSCQAPRERRAFDPQRKLSRNQVPLKPAPRPQPAAVPQRKPVPEEQPDRPIIPQPPQKSAPQKQPASVAPKPKLPQKPAPQEQPASVPQRKHQRASVPQRKHPLKRAPPQRKHPLKRAPPQRKRPLKPAPPPAFPQQQQQQKIGPHEDGHKTIEENDIDDSSKDDTVARRHLNLQHPQPRRSWKLIRNVVVHRNDPQNPASDFGLNVKSMVKRAKVPKAAKRHTVVNSYKPSKEVVQNLGMTASAIDGHNVPMEKDIVVAVNGKIVFNVETFQAYHGFRFTPIIELMRSTEEGKPLYLDLLRSCDSEDNGKAAKSPDGSSEPTCTKREDGVVKVAAAVKESPAPGGLDGAGEVGGVVLEVAKDKDKGCAKEEDKDCAEEKEDDCADMRNDDCAKEECNGDCAKEDDNDCAKKKDNDGDGNEEGCADGKDNGNAKEEDVNEGATEKGDDCAGNHRSNSPTNQQLTNVSIQDVVAIRKRNRARHSQEDGGAANTAPVLYDTKRLRKRKRIPLSRNLGTAEAAAPAAPAAPAAVALPQGGGDVVRPTTGKRKRGATKTKANRAPSASGGTTYKLDGIIAHKKKAKGGREYQFFVKWRSGEKTWEPDGFLKVDAPLVLGEYLRETGLCKKIRRYAWAKDENGFPEG